MTITLVFKRIKLILVSYSVENRLIWNLENQAKNNEFMLKLGQDILNLPGIFWKSTLFSGMFQISWIK